jgi:hypothetical protein
MFTWVDDPQNIPGTSSSDLFGKSPVRAPPECGILIYMMCIGGGNFVCIDAISRAVPSRT